MITSKYRKNRLNDETSVKSVSKWIHKETYSRKPSGHISIKEMGPDGNWTEIYSAANVITGDHSILIAWLMKNSGGPGGGAVALAVGSGDPAWDKQDPPAPTSTQRALVAEFFRKTFSGTSFRDENGDEQAAPSNIVDFTTTFAEAEAVGPWVEMGIVGGNAPSGPDAGISIVTAGGDASQEGVDILINYKTMKVINKPSGATYSLTWRIVW